jgi:hypothetical protein
MREHREAARKRQAGHETGGTVRSSEALLLLLQHGLFVRLYMHGCTCVMVVVDA